MLYVCEATEAEVLGEGPALTLDDYRGSGGATPAAATVVRTVEAVAWRCTVCGYIAERDTLPDDYRCPHLPGPKGQVREAVTQNRPIPRVRSPGIFCGRMKESADKKFFLLLSDFLPPNRIPSESAFQENIRERVRT